MARECPRRDRQPFIRLLTDRIGREDGGKTALDVLFCHATTRCLAHGECTVTSFECLRRTRKVWFWSFSTDPAVCLRVDVRLAARATFARKPTSRFKPAKRELESRAANSLAMRRCHQAVLPNRPRDPPPRHHHAPSSRAAAIAPLRWYVAATLPVPKAILHARHEIRCCKGLQSTTPARGDIEVTDSGMDVRSDAIPIKFRIFIDKVGGRFVAKLFVQTNFLKFVEERIGLFQIVRVAQVGR